jgi:hypothetical protein
MPHPLLLKANFALMDEFFHSDGVGRGEKGDTEKGLMC